MRLLGLVGDELAVPLNVLFQRRDEILLCIRALGDRLFHSKGRLLQNHCMQWRAIPGLFINQFPNSLGYHIHILFGFLGRLQNRCINFRAADDQLSCHFLRTAAKTEQAWHIPVRRCPDKGFIFAGLCGLHTADRATGIVRAGPTCAAIDEIKYLTGLTGQGRFLDGRLEIQDFDTGAVACDRIAGTFESFRAGPAFTAIARICKGTVHGTGAPFKNRRACLFANHATGIMGINRCRGAAITRRTGPAFAPITTIHKGPNGAFLLAVKIC